MADVSLLAVNNEQWKPIHIKTKVALSWNKWKNTGYTYFNQTENWNVGISNELTII